MIQPWPFLTPKAWRAKNVAGEKGGSESLPDRGVIAHALESHGDGLAKGKKKKKGKKENTMDRGLVIYEGLFFGDSYSEAEGLCCLYTHRLIHPT